MTRKEVVGQLMTEDFSKALIEVVAYMANGTNNPTKTVNQFIDAGLTHIDGYDTEIANDDIPASIIEFTVTELKEFVAANINS